MKKLIAVILGGASAERSVSLKTGQEVSKAIDRGKYDVIMLDGARQNEIDQMRGERYPSFEAYLQNAKNRKPDIAFLALHGTFGEDGGIQTILDNLKIAYTFSDAQSSRLAMDKIAAKKRFTDQGILVAPEIILTSVNLDSNKIVEKIGLPVVVKPVEQGSSFGISIARSTDQIQSALKDALKYDKKVMIEKYIKGKEITVAVVGNQEVEALPVIEICPKGKSEFFDYLAKYNESCCDEIVPARISEEETKEAQEIGTRAHLALGCSGISRTDMIIEEGTNKIYTLETNTIPGMTPASLLPKAAKAAGYSFPELIDLIIDLGFQKYV